MGIRSNMPKIPLVFLGLGLYRAWIEIVYVGTWIEFPSLSVAGQDVFDLAMVGVLLVCAALHRVVTPLFRKKGLLWTAAALTGAGTLVNFATIVWPGLASAVSFATAIACGAGVALLILIWSELYSCLSPYRVVAYYSASILACAVVVFVCRGFVLPYAAGASALLPIVSLACALKGFSSLPDDELPRKRVAVVGFPWKPVALMSIYAFAYGLRENDLTAVMGPMSSAGVVLASSIVLVGIVFFRERFDLDVMHRVALPAMVCSLVLVPASGFLGSTFANVCASLSYTAFSILIMSILCNLSRRYGFSAIMLFGLERGVRAIFSLLGRTTEAALGEAGQTLAASDMAVTGIVAVLVIVCAVMLWREPAGSARWELPLIEVDASEADATRDREGASEVRRIDRLSAACSLVRKAYQLTPREEDVLFLLVQGKSISEVADDLVIAKGTAKVHVRHIYEKLGVHARSELVDIVEERARDGALR